MRAHWARRRKVHQQKNQGNGREHDVRARLGRNSLTTTYLPFSLLLHQKRRVNTLATTDRHEEQCHLSAQWSPLVWSLRGCSCRVASLGASSALAMPSPPRSGRWLGLLAFLAALLAPSASFVEAYPTPDYATIGVVLPLSGDAMVGGQRAKVRTRPNNRTAALRKDRCGRFGSPPHAPTLTTHMASLHHAPSPLPSPSPPPSLCPCVS